MTALGKSSRLRQIAGWSAHPDLQAVVLLILFSLRFTLPALGCFFTFDLLMNLDRSVDEFWSHLVATVTVFPPPTRPLGGLVTMAIYHLLGFEPVNFYAVGIILFSLNLALLYWLARALSGSPLFALASAAVAGYCPANHNVLYNFGAVYELLTLTCVLSCLLCYRKHLAGSSANRYYWLALAGFVLALDSKEIAVAVPVVLIAYELLFHADDWRDRKLWGRIGKRMFPFLLVVVPYAIIKAVGPWSTGLGNPLYELHFDLRILDNFAAYLTALTNFKLEFSAAGALFTLILALVSALFFGNRVTLFGIVWCIVFLLPVLPLPRVWQLFLYVPLFGFALVVVSVLFEIGGRLLPLLFQEPPRIRYPRLWRLLLFLALTARLQGAMAPAFRQAYEHNYNIVNAPFRSLANQLFTRYPELGSGTALIFRDLPVREPFDQWIPQFLIQLHYRNRDIQVFNLPTQEQYYRRASPSKAAEKHFFSWENGQLLEEPAGVEK